VEQHSNSASYLQSHSMLARSDSPIAG